MLVADAVAVGDQVQRPQVGGQGPADAAFNLVECGGRCRRRQLLGPPEDRGAPVHVRAEPRHRQRRITCRGGRALLLIETGLGQPVAGVQDGLETAALPAQARDRVRERDQSILSGRPALDLQGGGLPASGLPQCHRQLAELREWAGQVVPQGCVGDGVAAGHRDAAPARRAGQYRPCPARWRTRDDLLDDPPRGPLNHVMLPSCRHCR